MISNRAPLFLILAITILVTPTAWAAYCPGECVLPGIGGFGTISCDPLPPQSIDQGCKLSGTNCYEFYCDAIATVSQTGEVDCRNEALLDQVLTRLDGSTDASAVLQQLDLRAKSDPAAKRLLESLRIVTPAGVIYEGSQHGSKDGTPQAPTTR